MFAIPGRRRFSPFGREHTRLQRVASCPKWKRTVTKQEDRARMEVSVTLEVANFSTLFPKTISRDD